MQEHEIDPDFIMPVQLIDPSFRSSPLHPENRLQLAVLADAAATYTRSAPSTADRDRAAFVELEEWFASESADGPFSFVGICDSLGFDPACIRLGLRMTRLRLGGRPGRVVRRVTGSRIREASHANRDVRRSLIVRLLKSTAQVLRRRRAENRAAGAR